MQSLSRPSLLGMVIFSLLAFVAGCEEKSSCETICVRVSECRREVPEEEKMLGEKTPHADKRCKQRCESNPDGFTACESKKKNCADLLSCAGRF